MTRPRPHSPRDGRCQRDSTYHERLRSDPELFAAEGISIGQQDAGTLVLELALCPGCGTTVSQIVSDDEGGA